MYDRIKEALIPPPLSDLLERESYRSWVSGLPTKEAIKKGIKIFNDYWEKKNADGV